MPEFKFAFDDDISSFCKKSGISRLFSNSANYFPMTAEKLMAEAIVHKAYVEVDRKGTKAFAVTAMYTVTWACPRFESIWLDKPFVFAIMNEETVLPIFAVVNDIVDVNI